MSCSSGTETETYLIENDKHLARVHRTKLVQAHTLTDRSLEVSEASETDLADADDEVNDGEA